LRDDERCDRQHESKDQSVSGADSVDHVAASTRRRRPKNQNMDTEPMA
jgi:hypothetical protein